MDAQATMANKALVKDSPQSSRISDLNESDIFNLQQALELASCKAVRILPSFRPLPLA